jgi:tetratricopeptide (TPR) repeat protein
MSRPRRSERGWVVRARLSVVAALAVAAAACHWDPSHPFDRDSPEVNQAIAQLDAGDASAAAGTLEKYLATGPCEDGNIGARNEFLRTLPDGTFDLGLSLFKIGESFGRRFGEEELDGGLDEHARRKAQTDCALRLVRAIAEDPSVPIELRAHARYLEGNLQFLNASYEDAVRAYDQAIGLVPGQYEAGDPVGADAAWNRAIALRRIDDKKDAGSDAASNDSGSQDAAQDAARDSGEDAAKDSGGQDSGGGNDGGADSGAGDSGENGQDSGQPPPNGDDAAAPPPPPSTESQDDRVLDMLENAPTVQQEDARRHAARRKVRGMEDK